MIFQEEDPVDQHAVPGMINGEFFPMGHSAHGGGSGGGQ